MNEYHEGRHASHPRSTYVPRSAALSVTPSDQYTEVCFGMSLGMIQFPAKMSYRTPHFWAAQSTKFFVI